MAFESTQPTREADLAICKIKTSYSDLIWSRIIDLLLSFFFNVKNSNEIHRLALEIHILHSAS